METACRKTEGTRPVGRPRMRWENNINHDLRKVDYTGDNWKTLAEDSEVWSSAHSPTFPSRLLRHNSFSNPFRHFTYVTAHSPTLPLLHLRHSSFSIPSFACNTSQALHLIHLASRPCFKVDT